MALFTASGAQGQGTMRVALVARPWAIAVSVARLAEALEPRSSQLTISSLASGP
jgi:hypothetical protein